MVKRRIDLMPVLVLAVGVSIAAASSGEPTREGRDFFLKNVVPELAKNGCPACHSVGYLRPDVLRYEELLRRLAIGDSAENNVVIYKLADIRSFTPDRPNHPGGKRCEAVDAEPCAALQAWGRIEFGDAEGSGE